MNLDSQEIKNMNPGRKNLGVFAFFVILSFVFWYLNSLSKDVEAELKYPVKFVNSEKSRINDHDLPERLSIVFEGPGYTVLRYKLTGRNFPLEIDFGRSARVVKGASVPEYFIITESLLQAFNSQIKSECKILGIKPDTLFIPGAGIQ